jgi:hypothetical protein
MKQNGMLLIMDNQIYFNLIEALGQAEESYYLNYQHHLCKICDALDKDDVAYAEGLAVAITNEMNANNGL